MDLKEFGSKFVLWMVDSFKRFIQGKHIPNKRANTIITALNDAGCMNVGCSSHGFFADNSGKFANVKLYELTSKIGLMVKFCLASNSKSKRNHASADFTIKRFIEEKKTALFDSLV